MSRDNEMKPEAPDLINEIGRKIKKAIKKEITPNTIKKYVLNKEIYSCLICDSTCGFSALEEGLQVIFHVCFNCVSLEGTEFEYLIFM